MLQLQLPPHVRKSWQDAGLGNCIQLRKVSFPLEPAVSTLFCTCRAPQVLKIAMVGKYTGLSDAYLSVIKALQHACLAVSRKLQIEWVDASQLEEGTKTADPAAHAAAWAKLSGAAGVLVPGALPPSAFCSHASLLPDSHVCSLALPRLEPRRGTLPGLAFPFNLDVHVGRLPRAQAALTAGETMARSRRCTMQARGSLRHAIHSLCPVSAGGFGSRGVEGKIAAAHYARTEKVPYLGICLGMQLAVVEFARSELGLADANSTEFESVGTLDPFWTARTRKTVSNWNDIPAGPRRCKLHRLPSQWVRFFEFACGVTSRLTTLE